MSLAATPIELYDAEPFLVTQEARLRRLCNVFATRALEALTDGAERAAFFQLMGHVPNELIEDMAEEELASAVDRKSRKVFSFVHLHERLHGAWQGFNLTVDGLVRAAPRRELVRHWFELAIIVAHTRACQPN